MPTKLKTATAQAGEFAPETEQKRYPTLPVQYHVRIQSIKPDGNIKCFASVNLNGQFAVRGVKVMQGSNGLYVAMPSYKSGSEYHDVCFPCTKEARQEFNATVIAAYQQALSQVQEQGQTSSVAHGYEQAPVPELAM